ncbi:MAG: dephospho-CoA kinase [Actinobacteria bacterium]|nr:MAG: dephospho-CoA kinase [Actinomycetota bacterium]
MILVGLTGGIGAGKSTVSALLTAHGAVVIDADAITRALQEPGQPVLAAIVERFGSGVLSADGRLDRAGLAEIVFADPDSLRDLNSIVHPAVGVEIARRIAAEQDSGRVVVLDVPLLVETGRGGLSGIVVVDVPTETAVERLVLQRGMSEDDARARVAVQASRNERLAKADVVIDNSTTREDLEKRVAEVWAWMQQLPDAERPPEPRGSVPPPR